jgi:DNA modification methylase
VSKKTKTPRRVADLILDDKNANLGTERGAGMLRQSLERFGAGRSILVDREGRIIAGNKTVERARAAGIDKLVVVPSDGRSLVAVQRTDLSLDDPEARALAIADNRVQEVDLVWDPEVLAELGRDVDLGAFFDQGELEELLGVGGTEEGARQEKAGAKEAPTDRAGELQTKWETRRGQVWGIPSRRSPGLIHRVMCGDATVREDVQRLFAGARANLVNTDPPYGVSYESARTGSIANDDLRGDRLIALLRGALGHAVVMTEADAAFYIWHASSTRAEFDYAIKAAGLEEKQYITWVKDSFVLGHADYHWQTEPCYYAQRAGTTAAFHGDRAQSTAWRLSRAEAAGGVEIANGVRLLDGAGAELILAPKVAKGKKLRVFRLADGETLLVRGRGDAARTTAWMVTHDRAGQLHPNQKPAELAVRAIENSTMPAGVVYDCFGGAGFTLIGAELTGRAALIMELDPKFVAVELERVAEMGLAPVEVSA